MKPITKILVANRGEIALRVLRTCREMGIATVAVFSDADEDALHTRAADEAVRIGPAPSTESYLAIEAILAAARRTGADAIHPGYGFLSENAHFARACRDDGVIFIGPTAEAIFAMGSKKEAKAIARKAGVPVIPGYEGDDQSTATLVAKAREVGFPVLLKASAGGGGKGMRIVREASGLEAAIDGARREARGAFGDDTLLIERYLERPRHVEIQILGDSQGNIVHLHERECSIQRRHQKIIEESPSVALDDDLRSRMGAAAVKVGKAIGYTNAGTVELILSPEGEFFFLEVNTRLQVEHPVTECITGLDLVREQIRIARGEALGFGQEDVPRRGAAIECRIYAEDPDGGFLPQSGRLVDWHVPDLPGLRVDAGVESGSEISIHYDPMLAKVITHGADRSEAIARMVSALRRLSAQGIKTNREYLVRILEHPDFASGKTDTHFIETHAADLAPPALDAGARRRAAIAATLAAFEDRRRARAILPSIPPGYRNNRVAYPWAAYDPDLRVEYLPRPGGRFLMRAGDGEEEVRLVRCAGPELTIEDGNGVRRTYRVVRDGARVFVQSLEGSFVLTEAPRFPERRAAAVPGALTAPMPGKIVKISVAQGDRVAAGAELLILEAMKMEHTVSAPHDGTVEKVMAEPGQQVAEGALLAVVAPA